jgi:hypothetical protein
LLANNVDEADSPLKQGAVCLGSERIKNSFYCPQRSPAKIKFGKL